MSATSSSASTCAANTEQGEHVFKISDYSLHRGAGAGHYIPSATFYIGGHLWRIHFYPDGYDRGHDMAVGLELMYKDASCEPVRVSYIVSLFDWSAQRFSSQPPLMVELHHPNLLALHYVSRSHVVEAGFVADDRFTVKYAVTVFKEPFVVAAGAGVDDVVVKVPPSDIVEHLGKLLETKEGADVTFVVQGEEFPAHKLVLAMRSPVFKAELYGPMSTNTTTTAADPINPSRRRRRIVVHDMRPAVFRDLLYFIYNDSLPATVMEDAGGLLAAADRYAMERLKLVCESLLAKQLDVGTVAATLALADRHTCLGLKDACFRFVASSTAEKIEELVTSKGYLRLKRTCPSTAMEMWEKASKLPKTQN